MGHGVTIGSALGGAVCGAWIAWLLAAGPGPAAVVPPPAALSVEVGTPDGGAADGGADGGAAAAPHREPAPAAASAPLAAGRETSALVSAALVDHARREFGRGWRELRSDAPPTEAVEAGLREFLETVETLPHRLGAEAARGRSEGEAKAALLAGDDLVALLDGAPEHDDELAVHARSERFVTQFRPRGGGSAVDGTSLERGRPVADGAVVAFPAGVFALPDLGRQDSYPSDVVVRGAGMDATLLVAESQSPRGPLVRLTVEDCTVSAYDLVDARSAPAVFCLRRVRLVGFDTGAGGSTALSAGRGCALLATDCRFESGYGRHPNGYASLLRANGARLVRFERCVAERVSLDDASAASVLFVDCTFTDMLEDQPHGPTFRNCRWTSLAAEHRWDEAHRRRDLNTLFPDWERRLARR